MPENIDYAREVLGAMPLAPTPATDYYIRQADGTIAHYISDRLAPYTLRRVVGPASDPVAPPTEVTRSGALTNRLALQNVDYVRQRIRPTVNIPLTAVTIDNASSSAPGGVAVAFQDEAGGAWIVGTAVGVGSGLQADMPDGAELIAGHTYLFHVGKLGNGANGTNYGGYLTSIQLSSGLSWTGLTLADNTLTYWDGSSHTVSDAPTPQIAAQYVTGDMSGVDRSGLTIRGVSPIAVSYEADSRTYTVGLEGSADVADGQGWAGGVFISPAGTAGLTPDYRFQALAPLTFNQMTLAVRYNAAAPGTAFYDVYLADATWTATGARLGRFTMTFPTGETTHTLSADQEVSIPSGSRWVLRATPGTAGSIPALRVANWVTSSDAPAARSMGTALTFYGVHMTASYETGDPALKLSQFAGLSVGDIGGLSSQLADHAARLSSLEARPVLDTEAIQDIVGAMLPGATYNDAAGTITLPPDQTLTPEQVQDIVGAFVAAGSNATVTYDDAANTLTISSTGGSQTTGLTAVSHDATLSGDGTPASPLKVVGGSSSSGSSVATIPVGGVRAWIDAAQAYIPADFTTAGTQIYGARDDATDARVTPVTVKYGHSTFTSATHAANYGIQLLEAAPDAVVANVNATNGTAGRNLISVAATRKGTLEAGYISDLYQSWVREVILADGFAWHVLTGTAGFSADIRYTMRYYTATNRWVITLFHHANAGAQKAIGIRSQASEYVFGCNVTPNVADPTTALCVVIQG
ncbi:hypothetical protein [Deinococcus navajonensis]|uniref:Minor tail protein n=1 Tax=Deinococcus navajonensis TaxID=309884 RepID=A0ABV8XNI7_9DEIO